MMVEVLKEEGQRNDVNITIPILPSQYSIAEGVPSNALGCISENDERCGPHEPQRAVRRNVYTECI